MDEEEIMVVIACPVGDHKARPVPGARIDSCCDCGVAVWISPKSDERIKLGYIIRCNECAVKAIKEKDPNEEVVLEGRKGQIEGFLKVLPPGTKVKYEGK